jgi:hypothetical protein
MRELALHSYKEAGVEKLLNLLKGISPKATEGAGKALDYALKNNTINYAPVILGAGYGTRRYLEDKNREELARATDRNAQLDAAVSGRRILQTWYDKARAQENKLNNLSADTPSSTTAALRAELARTQGGLEKNKNIVLDAIKAAQGEGTVAPGEEAAPLGVHIPAGVLAGVSVQPRYLYKSLAPMLQGHRTLSPGEVPKDPALTLATALGTSVVGGVAPAVYRNAKQMYSNLDTAGKNLGDSAGQLQELADPIKKALAVVDPETIKGTLDSVNDVAQTLKRTSGTLEKGVSDIGSNLGTASQALSKGLEEGSTTAKDMQQQLGDMKKRIIDALPSKTQLAVGGGLTLAGIIALMAWRNASERKSREAQAEIIGRSVAEGIRGKPKKKRTESDETETETEQKAQEV